MRLNLDNVIKLVNDLGTRWSALPQSVKGDILNTITEAIRDNIKKNASQGGMLSGEYNRNEVADSVVINQIGLEDYEINFEGASTHKTGDGPGYRVRLAEIAFLNEYGVPGKQKKREFIQKAIDVALRETYDKIDDIIGKWIETNIVMSL